MRVLFLKEGRGGFVCCDGVFFLLCFLFFALPSSSLLLIYFVVGSFGLGRCYMLHVITCQVGNFCVLQRLT